MPSIDLNKIINFNFNDLLAAPLTLDINSPAFQGIIIIPKFILVVLGFFFLGAIIYLLLRTNWLRFVFLESFIEFFTYHPYGIKKLGKSWLKISARLDTLDESEYKLAIIEADELLDHTLKKMGYTGRDLEERLKNLSSATLPNIEQVMTAHKTRNELVYDPAYRLDLDQVKRILDIYEQALRDLQTLD